MLETLPPYLVVIARGESEIWQSLSQSLGGWARDLVEMVWDRRIGERRGAQIGPIGERRHGERRGPVDLESFGFTVATRHEGKCQPCLRVGC